MPLYWRYVIQSFLKNFFLSITGFISVLLVSRLKEIARFAAICGSLKQVILYILYQIPHILPIAIPISCLIASLLFFQRLSKTSEMTAMRASGLSIFQIITPLLFISFWISIGNFFVSSEITSRTRLKSKEMITVQSSENPLLLLQRQKLLKIKNTYIDLTCSDDSTKAENVTLITYNKANKRLNYIFAKNFYIENQNLIGKNVSLISNHEEEENPFFDTMIIENQESMYTKAENLSQYLKTNHWSLNPNYLPMKLLLSREKTQSSQDKKYIKASVELARRFSWAFASLTFTIIGICFGIEIGRNHSTKKLLTACFLSIFILITLLFGKSLKYYPLPSILLYGLVQPIILIFSFYTLKKTSEGIE
ncbi:MAG TPA: LptF/LptG family permease [Chlamydiales bacterium]|nr:LptF/LptG family permease [Chlamydiales bacterium]